MKNLFLRLHKDTRGVSLLEILIASAMSILVIAAALEFYVSQHKTWMTQYDVAEIQHNARSCLEEIAGEMRMAGYGLVDHPAFALGQDSVTIYYADTIDVDTILYSVIWSDSTTPVLVRRHRAFTPEVYSVDVESLSVTRLSPTLYELAITSRGERPEEELIDGDGFRRRTLTTRVRVRNLTF